MSKTIICCGEPLECSGFTNTCPICERDYNWAGQGLAPRSCWGEETGETAADILMAEAEGFPDVDY
jgi:hypothetical protein